MIRQEHELPTKGHRISRLNPLVAPPPEHLQPLDWLLLRHIPSHRGLVEDLGNIDVNHEPITKMDAVIVPTSRFPTHLDVAARVAQFAQSPVVYLCSGDATVRGVFDHLAERNVDVRNISAIQLPEGYSLPDLLLATGTFPVPGKSREKDLSTKRNIGLALARMVGWQHVLFLDDDIQGMGLPQLNHTLTGFDNPDRHIVGWSYGSTSEGDPLSSDNSQVVQAYRMLDGEVETFIGGGASAIRITDSTAFFPDIYNEDWLFYAATMQHGRSAVARAGDLMHHAKDVFGYGANEISVDEEFGDTLAEGIFRAIHFDRSLTDSQFLSEPFWNLMDRARKGFITKLQEGLHTIPGEPYDHITKVLAASLSVHDDTWPQLLVDYTRTWFKDFDTWNTWYNDLPSFSSPSEALQHLGLKE